MYKRNAAGSTREAVGEIWRAVSVAMGFMKPLRLAVLRVCSARRRHVLEMLKLALERIGMKILERVHTQSSHACLWPIRIEKAGA